jgi:hypothetical protein
MSKPIEPEVEHDVPVRYRGLTPRQAMVVVGAAFVLPVGGVAWILFEAGVERVLPQTPVAGITAIWLAASLGVIASFVFLRGIGLPILLVWLAVGVGGVVMYMVSPTNEKTVDETAATRSDEQIRIALWGTGQPPPPPSSYRLKADEVPSRAKIALCDHPLQLTPEEILTKSGPYHGYDDPYPGGESLRYKHQCVQWQLPLRNWIFHEDVTELTFDTKYLGVGLVAVQVRAEDYPHLRTMEYATLKTSLFDVRGRIVVVREGRIFLRDTIISVVEPET